MDRRKQDKLHETVKLFQTIMNLKTRLTITFYEDFNFHCN